MMRGALSLRLCLTPRSGSVLCIHPKNDFNTSEEAYACMLQFAEEKSLLARSISEAYPEQGWSTLAHEAKLFVHTRVLKQRRRDAWGSIGSNPSAFVRWLWLTSAFCWQRMRLSYHRRELGTRLITQNLADAQHFQTLT